MQPRYIIRPRGIRSTPRELCRRLGAQRTIRVDSNQIVSYGRDFFLAYPPPHQATAQNYMTSRRLAFQYSKAHAFYIGTKPHQREIIKNEGFPVPETFSQAGQEEGTFIVRPFRHSGGRDYRITTNRNDFNPESEYIQRAVNKTHEYRVICIYGEPLITMIKRAPEDTHPHAAWNHTNGSTFVTVTQDHNNRLRHTGIYDKIHSSELLKSLSIAGIDVLFVSPDQYFVAEINLCPSLQIEDNLQKVANYVHSLSR